MNQLSDADFEAAPRKCLRGTWSIAQMRSAFDAVADKANWKNAIKATITSDQRDLTLDAIEWYCGNGAMATPLGNGRLYVFHDGYYAVIGT